MININVDKYSEQITEQFKKAFFDMINEQVITGKVDVEWFTELFIELKEKLMKLVKNEKIKQNINESFDDKLFSQMIANDVFDTDSLKKLVDNTFYWIEKLQAPVRDTETRNSKDKILSCPKETVISTFISESHYCIHNIEIDLQNYYKSLNNNSSE